MAPNRVRAGVPLIWATALIVGYFFLVYTPFAFLEARRCREFGYPQTYVSLMLAVTCANDSTTVPITLLEGARGP